MVGIISMKEWLYLCSNKFSLDYCHCAKATERSPMDQNSPLPPLCQALMLSLAAYFPVFLSV